MEVTICIVSRVSWDLETVRDKKDGNLVPKVMLCESR